MKNRLHKMITMLCLIGSLAASALTGCGSADGTDETQNAAAENGESDNNSDPFGAAKDPAVTLVYAEVNPADSISGMIAEAFKEKCEEYSGGSVTIDIRYSGSLGAEEEVIAAMMEGTCEAQIARISSFALNDLTERTPLLSLPFTFSSREHFWKFATSALSTVVLEESIEELPIKGLFYGEEGFRHFITREPITSYRQLKGMTIRVSNDPIMTEFVKAIDAEPSYVPFTELYYALQHGTVDAAEQPIINYQTNMFPEVALNLLLDGHTLGTIEVIITDEAWEQLTEAQQEAVMEACRYAQLVNRSSIEAEEARVLQELISNGVNVVEVSDTDKRAMKRECRKIVHDNTQGIMKELYDKILEMDE